MKNQSSDALWSGVDRVIDRTDDLEALRAHGLHLLAARRWRSRGRPIPPQLSNHEQMAAIATLAVPPMLQELRRLIDGPIVLLKGPEIAWRYPDPALRPFIDIDLLVADADAEQQKLIAAGYTLVRDERKDRGSHHRPPLKARGWPLHVEIHDAPGWLPWMSPPSSAELLRSAVPSRLAIDGVQTVSHREHVLLVAAHSWRHVPLRRALDLIDLAVMMEGEDPAALQQLAREWRMERLWNTTQAAVDALLFDPSRRSWSLSLWARHVPQVRELTDSQASMLRAFGALWAPSPGPAIGAAVNQVWKSVQPLDGESVPVMLRRTTRGLSQAVIGWSPFRDRR